MMNKQLWFLSLIVGLACGVTAAYAGPSAAKSATGEIHEEWKGLPDDVEYKFGALAGVGIIDSSAGFALLGTASKRILHQGFAPDINNVVFIEAQMGPLFVSGGTAFAYSTHLRWDFVRNPEWTFYALGGFAGHITDSSMGGRFLLFPRFGIGTLWSMPTGFAIRGEFSHELMAAGFAFSI